MTRAIVVVDLGFGDAGKGSVTDYLVRKHDAVAVVRYNGGPQAAHRVVLDDGREHIFAQFGSGTFVPGVQTFLSKHMMINPLNLIREEAGLRRVGVTDAFDRMAIDKRAIVITPIHRAANRLRELARGDGRHGSTGQGVGEATWDALNKRALRVEDLCEPALASKLLALLRQKKIELAPILSRLDPDLPERRIFDDPDVLLSVVDDYVDFTEKVSIVGGRYLHDLHAEGTVIYEGAQGVLLDQDHGFHPYTTWARTTYANATELIRPILFANEWMTIGVLRAYATRHGAGPFPTEDTELDLPDEVNAWGRWQGAWRVGHFDALLARYALAATGGVSGLALTCLDRIEDEWKLCANYKYTGSFTDLRPYFSVLQNRYVKDLRLSPYLGSHAHTEALGNRLVDCLPLYHHYSRDQVVPAVEEWLGVPVVLTSSGETAAEKEQRDPVSRLTTA